ncbi:lamin tail domain-containing protein [Zobellia nedashkovskayae]|uniref:lamin tail domain-containing protein n=2 Tax=Zobellia nedashkovskayae TaxID=2779510 RepID=UPI0039EE9CED
MIRFLLKTSFAFKVILSTVIIFLMTVECFAQPSNDDYANAINVSSLINTCSADAAYTTVGATPDLNAGSNWNNGGPLHNVWFSFVATTNQINITVDIGGTKGSQARTQLALWEADGITELTSDNYYPVFTDVDVDVDYIGLTVGNTYYISVDGFNNSSPGTFTLCLNDAVNYDFYEGAIDVDYLINNCSNDAEFSTDGATPDRNAGLYWDNSGPVQNRWFKFTAPNTDQFNVTVDIGDVANGPKGNQYRTQIAIWEADGTTEVSSTRYSSQYANVTLGVPGLTAGDTYYISIDVTSEFSAGTFTLCLDANDKQGNIVINEVLFDETSSGAEGNDEFIELYNAGITAVDLAGWKLMDGNLFVVDEIDFSGSITGNSDPFLFSCSGSEICSGSTILQPGDYAVIWVGSQSTSKNAPNATFQAWLDKTSKLNNTGDDIWLYDSNTTLVDYIAYGTNSGINQPPLPVIWNTSVQATLDNAGDGQSISLSPNGVDGDSSDCWEPTTSAQASGRCSGYLPTYDTDTSARITSPGGDNNDPDTDKDGISDSVDLDDDNDGILDEDECLRTSNLVGNGDFSNWIFYSDANNPGWTGSGNQWNLDANRAWFPQWNGTGTASFYQTINVSAGSENSITFDVGANTSYNNEVALNVLVDGTTMFSETSNQIVATNGGQSQNGNATSNMVSRTFVFTPVSNTITLRFDGISTSGNHDMMYVDNVIVTTGCSDSDGDGILNVFDLDSDNDGIYDVVEAGHDEGTHTDGRLTEVVGLDGVPDSVQDVGQEDSGVVNYTISDSDSDSMPDFIELDSDGDGCNDVIEAGYSENSTISGELSGTGYDKVRGVVVDNSDGYTTPLDENGNSVYDYRESGVAPAITNQPEDVYVVQGADATFLVEATGGNLRYQWQLSIDNGLSYTDISGANNSSYTITNVPGSLDGNYYRVVVSDLSFSCISRTSESAILIILLDNDNDGIANANDLDDDNDGIPDEDELSSAANNSQNDCTGETLLDFSATASLVSGTALQQGAVYRIPNITTGIDALVTIAQTNNATVAALDNNDSEANAFRPQTSFNLANVGDVGYIEYTIRFVNSGGTTPAVVEKFFMNFNDIDGNSSYAEQSWSDNPTNYIVSDPTELTMTIDNSWTVGTSGTNEYDGAGNSNPEVNFGVSYNSKSEVSIRVGVVARSAGASAGGRQHNIEFSCLTNYENPTVYGVDSDSDGIPDYLDLDSDNDGIYDAVEAGHNSPHVNGVVSGNYGDNGLADVVETSAESGTLNYSITNTDSAENPDFLDTDSDNDGCSDANEAYADANADGGDNEYYDIGSPPSIDANGLVTAASYSVPQDIDGNSSYDYQEAGAPTITEQPADISICPGCTGSFTIVTTNTDTFQWQFYNGSSWVDLTDTGIHLGTNTNTLTVTNVTPSDNGNQYRVVISSSTFICASETSNTAILTVAATSVITNRRITYRVKKN